MDLFYWFTWQSLVCLWFLIKHTRVSQFSHVIVPPQETREMDKETVITRWRREYSREISLKLGGSGTVKDVIGCDCELPCFCGCAVVSVINMIDELWWEILSQILSLVTRGIFSETYVWWGLFLITRKKHAICHTLTNSFFAVYFL